MVSFDDIKILEFVCQFFFKHAGLWWGWQWNQRLVWEECHLLYFLLHNVNLVKKINFLMINHLCIPSWPFFFLRFQSFLHLCFWGILANGFIFLCWLCLVWYQGCASPWKDLWNAPFIKSCHTVFQSGYDIFPLSSKIYESSSFPACFWALGMVGFKKYPI